MSSVRISTTSGRVHVRAEPRDDVEVEGDADVSIDPGCTTVSGQTGKVLVRVPIGTNIRVGTNAGRVTMDGPIGDVAVVTESGRVEVDNAQDVDVRSGSGRVKIARANGWCRVRSVSGRVEVGACAGADVSTDSGRVSLAGVEGPTRAHCVDGRIDLEMTAAADVDAATVTGRIQVSFPRGVEAGVDCTVATNSISGRVEVTNR
ncbi:MAG: DUF4097 family beta strand repeat protein [Actinomycetia bacterium]|nr:DUF4097 family beta strand repeat protein [Actinomycetes bacterium]